MATDLASIARRDARIICLQSELLDHSGHVWADLPARRARVLATEINSLRRAAGWRPLAMRGRWQRA